ncbi:uncharacterized protein [Physcomitrium patens]|uniref:Dehydrin n=1 Tax=Physcomitrium patens TaxID=3218 RepID=A9U2L3_PHYPA|nr:dehydrin ERD10-like [Physcomitrium patens]PNR53879.1 hypothetical protein PHYPA_007554 [Physcomitrium patens]|eukprot:XP_024376881.1 dehydrin ERD10-like [Physcomitrella patens]
MAAQYTQDQSTEFRPELDEPRRTTTTTTSTTGSGLENENFGGYGGVSENEPPRHKIHSEDEPLPKPMSGTYLDEEGAKLDQDSDRSGLGASDLGRDEHIMPKPTSEGYPAGTPQSTEKYQEHRDLEPTRLDESPKTEEFGAANASTGDFDRTSSDGLRTDKTPASEPRGFRSEDTAPTSGGYADPTSAFPGAPIDRRVEEPGYGYDQQTSEPTSLESGTQHSPKKEGFMTKLKEKLPGHHKTPESGVEHQGAGVEHDTTDAPPKKGLMTKIKEKLPGHHSTAPASTTTDV